MTAAVYGEQAATGLGLSVGDGELGVFVPRIVPPFVIVVPALTLPVIRPPPPSTTLASAERTVPPICDEPSVAEPLENTLALLPLFAPPYGPAPSCSCRSSSSPLNPSESSPTMPGIVIVKSAFEMSK